MRVLAAGVDRNGASAPARQAVAFGDAHHQAQVDHVEVQ